MEPQQHTQPKSLECNEDIQKQTLKLKKNNNERTYTHNEEK